MKITKDRKQIAKRTLIASIIWMIIQIGVSIYLTMTVNYSHMRDQYKVDMGMDIICMVLCLILLYSCYQDDLKEKNHRSIARLIAIIGIALFINILEGFCEMRHDYRLQTKILVTLEYICDDLIVISFLDYIFGYLSEKKWYKTINRICLIFMYGSILGTILNFYFEHLFYVDQNGKLIEKILLEYAAFPEYLVYILIIILVFRENSTLKEKIIIISFEILPMIGVIITDLGFKYSVIYPFCLLSVVLIYINVYQSRKKKIIEQEALLTKQNMALMISQIQPHFLYNTLTTISNLCVKDPEQAEETTVMFSRYLRGNLDSLRITEPVPFQKELDHIQIYVELEQRRFGDRLNVTYDIQDMDFRVPSLGLQPIVENSIKHGICKRTEPGHLIISTRKTQNAHVVIIEDDGVGFDPAAPVPEDGRSHVGMTNVRNRLERMCAATMEVISSPGNGCRTTITFPIK